MVDECAAFMVASTQTTSISLLNVMKRLISNPASMDACKKEIKYLMKGNIPRS